MSEAQRRECNYIVARANGKIVGGASLHPRTDKRSHVAVFGVFIRDDYRNLGLGTTLTTTLTEIAKERGFEILQLSVYDSNKRAFYVYKKCGYKECGRFTRDIKFLDGTYTDRILMELLLKKRRQEPELNRRQMEISPEVAISLV